MAEIPEWLVSKATQKKIQSQIDAAEKKEPSFTMVSQVTPKTYTLVKPKPSLSPLIVSPKPVTKPKPSTIPVKDVSIGKAPGAAKAPFVSKPPLEKKAEPISFAAKPVMPIDEPKVKVAPKTKEELQKALFEKQLLAKQPAGISQAFRVKARELKVKRRRQKTADLPEPDVPMDKQIGRTIDVRDISLGGVSKASVGASLQKGRIPTFTKVTPTIKQLSTTIMFGKGILEKHKSTFEKLDKRIEAYNKQEERYLTALDTFNAQVKAANQAGGASLEEIKKFDSRSAWLTKEGENLKRAASSLSDAVEKINNLGQQTFWSGIKQLGKEPLKPPKPVGVEGAVASAGELYTGARAGVGESFRTTLGETKTKKQVFADNVKEIQKSEKALRAEARELLKLKKEDKVFQGDINRLMGKAGSHNQKVKALEEMEKQLVLSGDLDRRFPKRWGNFLVEVGEWGLLGALGGFPGVAVGAAAGAVGYGAGFAVEELLPPSYKTPLHQDPMKRAEFEWEKQKEGFTPLQAMKLSKKEVPKTKASTRGDVAELAAVLATVGVFAAKGTVKKALLKPVVDVKSISKFTAKIMKGGTKLKLVAYGQLEVPTVFEKVKGLKKIGRAKRGFKLEFKGVSLTEKQMKALTAKPQTGFEVIKGQGVKRAKPLPWGEQEFAKALSKARKARTDSAFALSEKDFKLLKEKGKQYGFPAPKPFGKKWTKYIENIRKGWEKELAQTTQRPTLESVLTKHPEFRKIKGLKPSKFKPKEPEFLLTQTAEGPVKLKDTLREPIQEMLEKRLAGVKPAPRLQVVTGKGAEAETRAALQKIFTAGEGELKVFKRWRVKGQQIEIKKTRLPRFSLKAKSKKELFTRPRRFITIPIGGTTVTKPVVFEMLGGELKGVVKARELGVRKKFPSPKLPAPIERAAQRIKPFGSKWRKFVAQKVQEREVKLLKSQQALDALKQRPSVKKFLKDVEEANKRLKAQDKFYKLPGKKFSAFDKAVDRLKAPRQVSKPFARVEPILTTGEKQAFSFFVGKAGELEKAAIIRSRQGFRVISRGKKGKAFIKTRSEMLTLSPGGKPIRVRVRDTARLKFAPVKEVLRKRVVKRPAKKPHKQWLKGLLGGLEKEKLGGIAEELKQADALRRGLPTGKGTSQQVFSGGVTKQKIKPKPVQGLEFEGLISETPQVSRAFGEAGRGIMSEGLSAGNKVALSAGLIPRVRQPISFGFKPIKLIKPVTKLSPFAEFKPSPLAKLKPKSLAREKAALAERLAPVVAEELVPAQALKPAQALAQKQALKQKAVQAPAQVPVMAFPAFPEPFKPFLLPLAVPRGSGVDAGKKVQGYNAMVREKGQKVRGKWVSGKFIKANKEPLPLAKARAFGADIVDKSSAATFKPVKARKKAVAQKFSLFDLWPKHKFDRKKNMFIEKNRYRIDSRGELNQITAKGLLALRRRRAGLVNPFVSSRFKTRKRKRR